MSNILLTGGMGMGKSTVGMMFRERQDCLYLDADAITHDLYGWYNGPIEGERMKSFFEVLTYGRVVIDHVKKYDPALTRMDLLLEQEIVDRYALIARIQSDADLLPYLEKEIAQVLWEVMFSRYIVYSKWPPLLANLASLSRLCIVDIPYMFEGVFDPKPLLQARPVDETLALVGTEPLSFHEAFQRIAPHNTLTVVVSCSEELQRARCMARPNMTTEKFELLKSRQWSDQARREQADYVIDTSGTLDEVTKQVDRILVHAALLD